MDNQVWKEMEEEAGQEPKLAITGQKTGKDRKWLMPLIIFLSIAVIGGATAVALLVADNNAKNAESQNVASGNDVEAVEATIDLADNSSTTSNVDAVKIDGNNITIKQPGEYTLSGALSSGSVVVEAGDGAVTLVLGGISITNEDGPAIVFKQTSASYIVLTEGSENSLTDGTVADEDYDAALYSVATLTLSGEGSLTVNGRSQEGIATENDLIFESGNYNITAYDDGLNANQDGVSVITINGGTLNINAGGDGIDSNGDLVINGGVVIAAGDLTDANGGLDADGTIEINGGTVIAMGERNSLPASSSGQKSLLVSFETVLAAGTKVAVRSGETTVAAFELTKRTSELVVSAAGLADGASYGVYTGVTLTGGGEDGVYASSTGGTQVKTVTTDSIGSGSSSGRR